MLDKEVDHIKVSPGKLPQKFQFSLDMLLQDFYVLRLRLHRSVRGNISLL